MDTNLCQYSKIPLTLPSHLRLFLLSKNEADQDHLDEILDNLKVDSRISITNLCEAKIDQFLTLIPLCNMSAAEKELAVRTNSILYIEIQITPDSIFDAFWKLLEVASELNEIFEDSMVVDLEQGVVVNLNSQYFEIPSNKMPLARDYLTVKAFESEDKKTLFLISEGMIRFGLDEIELPHIPYNLGADGAYLIRTVAQYLFARLKHVEPHTKFLRIERILEIPTEYLEYDNPDFQELDLTIPSIRLESISDGGSTTSKIQPASNGEDYCGWLLEIITSIKLQRTRIGLMKESISKEMVSN